MILKIKSISDVITNSSTEVFKVKMDDDYEKLKSETKSLSFHEFKTEKDVEAFVKEGFKEYDPDEHNISDALPDTYALANLNAYDLLEMGKSWEEIWDFFKKPFLQLIGCAFTCAETENEDIDEWNVWRNLEFKQNNQLYTYDRSYYYESLGYELKTNDYSPDITAVAIKIDDGYSSLIQTLGPFAFWEFRTMEDVEKFVRRRFHDGYLRKDIHDAFGKGRNSLGFLNPYWAYDVLGKTWDEIWEFFKVDYERLLGYAVTYKSTNEGMPYLLNDLIIKQNAEKDK